MLRLPLSCNDNLLFPLRSELPRNFGLLHEESMLLLAADFLHSQ